MDLVPLAQFPNRSAYLTMKPQLFVTDVHDRVDLTPKEVSTLDDIPHYQSTKQQIDLYVKNRRRRRSRRNAND
jgi:hypothetical protein